MELTSKLHNMESLDDIIEDVNKNIKKVFLAGVAHLRLNFDKKPI